MKIRAFKEKYRGARVAKLALERLGEWEQEWRPLADGNVRVLQDFDPNRSADNEAISQRQVQTKGWRMIPWIWQGAERKSDGLVTSCCPLPAYLAEVRAPSNRRQQG